MNQETKKKITESEKAANKEEKEHRNEIVEKQYSLLARNIKCLLKIYGERQADLAEAIGVGESTISNYVRDIQPPERNELFLIAEHYNVSIDDLINYDFSNDFIEINALLNDVSNRQVMYNTLLPIVNIDDNNPSANFREAYNLHLKIRDEICKSDDGMDFAKNHINRCTRLYVKAAEEGNMEAVANLLWWPMLQSITLAFFNKKTEKMQGLKSKDATIGDMLRAAYLKNYNDLDDDFEDDAACYICSEYYGIIIGNIALLKNSDDALLRDLGDYYMAIGYKYNVLGIDRISKMRSRLVGEELLSMLYIMENQFANDYFDIFRNQDNSEETE